MALRNVAAGMLGAAAIAVSAPAWAAPGVVVGGVDLRAGPGVDYPEIAPLPPGTGTEIFGCLPGWTWCDIAVNGPDGGVRGWAAGERLQVLYDNRPGYLPQYGAALGLPLVGFSIGSYWDRYYRGEPWYGSEGRWRGRDYGDRGDFAGGFDHGGGPDRGRPGPGPVGRPGEFHGGGDDRGRSFQPGYRGPGGGEPRPQQFGGTQPRPQPGSGPHPGPGPGGNRQSGPQGGGHEGRGGPGDHRPN